jgi:hypothetical protein
MQFIFDLVQLIKFSPKRSSLFDSLRREVALNSVSETPLTPTLRTLCPTRWTVRHSAIYSILLNYEVLQRALDDIQTGNDEYASKASGLLSKMENFDTFFSLKLAYLIYSAAEKFSTNLQAVSITVQEASCGAQLLSQYLKSLRTEEKFEVFYDHVLKESSSLTEEPILPRPRKLPKRFNDGGSAHQYPGAKDKYRHAYFEALELGAGEVDKRFNQQDFLLIKEIEGLLIKSANGETVQPLSDTLLKYFDNDIDPTQLTFQLAMIPTLIKTALDDTIKKVTNIRTIADAMEKSDMYKNMLTEVDKLLRIYFCFPVTSATAERSFSLLRRIKTFLRSTMCQTRLNNLFTLFVYTSKTDALDLNGIAKEFVSVNNRRKNYFGSF